MRRFLRLKRADFFEAEDVPEAWEIFDKMLRGLRGEALSLARRRVCGDGGVSDETWSWLLGGQMVMTGEAGAGEGERATMMAEGLLRSRPTAELREVDFSCSPVLVCERCFWASWSMTAA